MRFQPRHSMPCNDGLQSTQYYSIIGELLHVHMCYLNVETAGAGQSIPLPD